MSDTETTSTPPPPERRASNPTRIYIILAVLLVLVIVLVGAVLIFKGIPALKGEPTETAPVAIEPTLNPTFTPAPTQPPADTPAPTEPISPTAVPGPVMANTDSPQFELKSAGARPGTDWTGFFGQVLDAQGSPLAGVPIIVWYSDGTAAVPVARTDAQGNYEIRLADGPLTGMWSIQVLTPELQPASKLQTFQTDENTTAGIQQIQVIWQQVQ